MAFQPSALDSPVDFPEKANTPLWVYGRDQMVYWEQCYVSVIEKDGDGNKSTTATYEKSDGKAMVPTGTELYFSGGKVKEK
ncbi:hypothetical protein BU23DRAFT_549390 [Bimuria novae-zelandiae CBS 107.79]|uniref:Uncharacterized protein n=1 Tax=Bimuria novae-zelandiae CBS 107.79 TaxID=1447943 RepID=A0A6A5W1V3_9PLEO|nr:hypothetical protein BU23DRAFT_549390 [Bimuria novae-zelandiae CBS 107.79]